MSFRAVAYQKKLQDAGVDAKVAQTHAEAMEEFVVSELVTNDHLDSKLAQMDAKLTQMDAKFEARFTQIEARITELRADMRGELRSLEATLIRWMVGTMGVAFGLALAFMRLLR